eukprot:362722_1
MRRSSANSARRQSKMQSGRTREAAEAIPGRRTFPTSCGDSGHGGGCMGRGDMDSDCMFGDGIGIGGGGGGMCFDATYTSTVATSKSKRPRKKRLGGGSKGMSMGGPDRTDSMFEVGENASLVPLGGGKRGCGARAREGTKCSCLWCWNTMGDSSRWKFR